MVIKFNNIDKAELAYELFYFDEYGIYKRKVKNILKELTKKGEHYPDRQDVFLKAIDIIGNPITPKERYVVAKAYLWSRYPFKLKGIEYGNLYINNELWEDAFNNAGLQDNIDDNYENRKNIHIAEFLKEIGKIHESKYQFNEALECYTNEVKLCPYFAHTYIDLSNILVKLGRKEEALKLLENTRNSKYYKPFKIKTTRDLDDSFKIVIEKQIKDIKEKIKRNYKYRPRPSKNKPSLTKNEYNNLNEIQKKYLQEYIDKELIIIE